MPLTILKIVLQLLNPRYAKRRVRQLFGVGAVFAWVIARAVVLAPGRRAARDQRHAKRRAQIIEHIDAVEQARIREPKRR